MKAKLLYLLSGLLLGGVAGYFVFKESENRSYQVYGYQSLAFGDELKRENTFIILPKYAYGRNLVLYKVNKGKTDTLFTQKVENGDAQHLAVSFRCYNNLHDKSKITLKYRINSSSNFSYTEELSAEQRLLSPYRRATSQLTERAEVIHFSYFFSSTKNDGEYPAIHRRSSLDQLVKLSTKEIHQDITFYLLVLEATE